MFRSIWLVGTSALIAVSAPTAAQELKVAERPVDADSVVGVYASVAPGSEDWTWHEQVTSPPWGGRGGRLIRNTVQPTLTIFNPPNAARNVHTAVIIAPGGGFQWLSIDSEGYDVARALAAQGVTAMVLKYRLNHTPDDEGSFIKFAYSFLGGVTQGVGKSNAASAQTVHSKLPDLGSMIGTQDGLAAIKYVRAHAAALNIDPNRVGIIGFSAGGMVASVAATKYDAQSRPNFVGLIYGAPFGPVDWPSDTPPAFLAVANGDALARPSILQTYEELSAGHHAVELHVFNAGGHGFGMTHLGLDSDLWISEFSAWLGSLGYLNPEP